MTVVVYRAEDVSTRLNFERVADKAVGRIDDRITRYLTLLQATNAFFTARDGVVTKAETVSYTHLTLPTIFAV